MAEGRGIGLADAVLCGARGAHLLGDLGLTGYDDGAETVGITVLTVTP